MHVLNNFLAFGLALAFSDMSSALNPSGGTWWSIPVTLTQSLVYLGVAMYAARRSGIATAVDGRRRRRFGGLGAPRVRSLLGSVAAVGDRGQPGRTPVRQWDMV